MSDDEFSRTLECIVDAGSIGKDSENKVDKILATPFNLMFGMLAGTVSGLLRITKAPFEYMYHIDDIIEGNYITEQHIIDKSVWENYTIPGKAAYIIGNLYVIGFASMIGYAILHNCAQ
jgi:hypothetical protein